MRKLLFILLGLSVLIGSLAIAYHYVIFLPKKEKFKLAEQESEKERNQESFDNCIHKAEYEFKREYRNACWVYNHDAIDCDLSYFETHKMGDTPQAKFKKAIEACQEKHPVANRLYSTTSPQFKSLLTPPGKISEREAVKKMLGLSEYQDFIRSLGEGYKVTYTIEEPKEDSLYWLIHLYKYSTSGEEITLNYYKVDALNGSLSVEKR
jgi:hypothetical protein